MKALKMKKVEDDHALLTTNNYKQLLKKTPTKCERNVSDSWRQYFNSFMLFIEHWKGEKNLINKSLMSTMSIKNLQNLKFVQYGNF